MGAIDVIGIEARRVLIEALMSVAWADRTLTDEEWRRFVSVERPFAPVC